MTSVNEINWYHLHLAPLVGNKAAPQRLKGGLFSKVHSLRLLNWLAEVFSEHPPEKSYSSQLSFGQVWFVSQTSANI